MQIKIYEGPISGYDPMKAAKLVEKMANDKSYSYFKRTSSQHSKSGQKKIRRIMNKINHRIQDMYSVVFIVIDSL